jgi:hypothetical protein
MFKQYQKSQFPQEHTDNNYFLKSSKDRKEFNE